MTALRKNMAQTVCLNQPVVLFFRHSASSLDVFLWWFHAFVGFGFQFVDICPLVFEAPINYRKAVRFYDISADFGAEALCSGLTENVCPRGTDSLQLGKGNLRGPSNWTVSLQKDAAILSNCIISEDGASRILSVASARIPSPLGPERCCISIHSHWTLKHSPYTDYKHRLVIKSFRGFAAFLGIC